MPKFVPRLAVIQKLAIDRGILRPNGAAIAKATNLPAGTINAMFAGRPPSARTVATLALYFDVAVSDIFEAVEDDGVAEDDTDTLLIANA